MTEETTSNGNEYLSTLRIAHLDQDQIRSAARICRYFRGIVEELLEPSASAFVASELRNYARYLDNMEEEGAVAVDALLRHGGNSMQVLGAGDEKQRRIQDALELQLAEILSRIQVDLSHFARELENAGYQGRLLEASAKRVLSTTGLLLGTTIFRLSVRNTPGIED